MTEQGRLFDPAEGERRRERAITIVDEAADNDWKDAAETAIGIVASRLVTFTTDDVWAYLDVLKMPPPREPRAMGAMMRQAQRNLVIVPTARWQLSKRPECHRRPLRVWLSNNWVGS
jgi:hypothetical protein